MKRISVSTIKGGNISEDIHYFITESNDIKVGDTILCFPNDEKVHVREVRDCQSNITNAILDIVEPTKNSSRYSTVSHIGIIYGSGKGIIEVSLEEAREWYNSGSERLKTLALRAFDKDSLKPDIDCIRRQVSTHNYNINVAIPKAAKCEAIASLETIARYFNGTWRKTKNDTGYYIVLSSDGNFIVSKTTLQRAGVTYFQNEKDAEEALNILGDKVRYLFD